MKTNENQFMNLNSLTKYLLACACCLGLIIPTYSQESYPGGVASPAFWLIATEDGFLRDDSVLNHRYTFEGTQIDSSINYHSSCRAVSYTHLTLPTILLV